jgi:chromosome partitioning protein
VRKLLVVSQRGGVGKTTSSINLAAAAAQSGARVLLLDADPLSSVSASLNLAQHPRRCPLRANGFELPGVLCSGVVPGLDVLSPYEDGSCTDAQLDQLLELLTTPVVQSGYSCLVVDAPPFLGPNPGQLLATCDEYIIVMKAEPLAYRTLPAFLELVQRSKKGDIKLRGILVTLPDGEQPGGRWERELRGRFGSRILPHVIPHDEEVAKALLFSQVLVHNNRDCAAAQAYRSAAAALELAADAVVVAAPAESVLLAAAAVHQTERPRAASPAATMPAPAVADLALDRVSPAPPVVPSHAMPDLQPWHAGPPAMHDLHLDSEPPPAAAAASAPTVAAAEPPPTPPFQVPSALWIAFGIFLGVGMRFVHLPPDMIPMAVGLAVGLFMLLVLSVLVVEEKPALAGAAPPNGHAPDPRKPAGRPPADPRRDDSTRARLATLARRPGERR